MQTTIQKWGNSQGIRIPKAFLDALNMMENDIVELNRVDDNIVIRKVEKKNDLTLDDIFNLTSLLFFISTTFYLPHDRHTNPLNMHFL